MESNVTQNVSIMSGLERLERSVDDLHEIVSSLGIKLSSVCCDTEPKDISSISEAPSRSEVFGRIDTYADRVDSASARLNSLLSRIDLP